MIVHRRTARVLLIDHLDRMLLFADTDPGVPGVRWWITPGGGVEPGETDRQAALREIGEETGLRLDDASLIGPIGVRVGTFHYSDRSVENDETYFLATVPPFDIDISGHTDEEKLLMATHRWWSIEELAATSETLAPPALVELWRTVLPPTDLPPTDLPHTDLPPTDLSRQVAAGAAATVIDLGHEELTIG